MSYKSQGPGASRYFDHLYDPTFEISGPKNFYQYNYAALSMSAKMQIIPIYNTMFTDLPTRGRCFYAPVRNPLPYYSYYAGGEKSSNEAVDGTALVGQERYKYFSQPINKKFELALIDDKLGKDDESLQKSREIGCQTVYRESSAQTKPWMPNGIIGKNEQKIPEVVYVADLIKNDTLPGDFEAEIVERARKRRAWEKSLEKFKATKDWKQKKYIVQAFEWEQWVARENEMQDCQRLRLKIIERLMAKRDMKNKENTQIRLQHFNERVIKDKDNKLINIKVKYQREMRKLEMKHKKVEKKYVPVDIATEHIDRASDLYGPQMRFGKHPRQKNYHLYKTEFEPRFDTNEKIELDSIEIHRILQTKDKLWKPKIQMKTIERSLWTDAFLTNLYETLKLLRQTHDAVGKTKQPKCVIKIQKCHTIITHLEKKEDARINEFEYQNTIYFQKLIKGRAVQNILYRGRNKCRDLIAELQSVIQLADVTALYPSQLNIIQKHKELVLDQQSKLENLEHMCEQIKEIPTQADSSYMYFLFDFLGKELVRLEDNRKSHALYLLAEEERYKREAAEAGQRQVEELQRQQYDEIYRRIVRSTQDTVETYLENVLTEGIDKIAEHEAVGNVRRIARRIDTQANATIGSEDRSTVEEIVSNFVFPEVYKYRARETMKYKQQRHLLAAHLALYEVVEEIPFIKKAPTSNERFAAKIIHELIDEMPTTPISELSLSEDPAKHEALRAINNIINDLESSEGSPCCSSTDDESCCSDENEESHAKQKVNEAEILFGKEKPDLDDSLIAEDQSEELPVEPEAVDESQPPVNENEKEEDVQPQVKEVEPPLEDIHPPIEEVQPTEKLEIADESQDLQEIQASVESHSSDESQTSPE